MINDDRIVMTLDAGGTNLEFNAVRGGLEIIEPVNLSAEATSLDEILRKIIKGFEIVKSRIIEQPVAISFAFPGPADFENGIIGDLQNLPVFRGGVALGKMLKNEFKIPVFINNDGDLFTYGEAMSGLLPKINEMLEKGGITKRYYNLLGVTLGTGFGGGIVTHGKLFLGDNSAAGEINRMRNRFFQQTSVEDSVTIRAVMKSYQDAASINSDDVPVPKEIFEIAKGEKIGDKAAAKKAFKELAISAADAIADAVTLIDGLVVIGGGLSGAFSVFLDDIVEEMNHKYTTLKGENIDRMEVTAYNLENNFNEFRKDTSSNITVPFSNEKVKYDPIKKIGVGITRLGTSKAVSVGAYAFALDKLGRK
jgi:glucokinase